MLHNLSLIQVGGLLKKQMAHLKSQGVDESIQIKGLPNFSLN